MKRVNKPDIQHCHECHASSIFDPVKNGLKCPICGKVKHYSGTEISMADKVRMAIIARVPIALNETILK